MEIINRLFGNGTVSNSNVMLNFSNVLWSEEKWFEILTKKGSIKFWNFDSNWPTVSANGRSLVTWLTNGAFAHFMRFKGKQSWDMFYNAQQCTPIRCLSGSNLKFSQYCIKLILLYVCNVCIRACVCIWMNLNWIDAYVFAVHVCRASLKCY